jgi:putative nucleotidyltransferase with HDIG domain
MPYAMIIDHAAGGSLWQVVPELRSAIEVVDIRLPRRRLRPSVQGLIIDVNLSNAASLAALRSLMADLPHGLRRLVACNPGSRRDLVQAHALEATETTERPLGARVLVDAVQRWTAEGEDFAAHDPLQHGLDQALRISDWMLASGETLEVDRNSLEWGAEAVMSAVAESGARRWIDSVRTHHRPTYRHCLLVNGLAVAFAQGIGLGKADAMQVSVAAMLHDVGKARVPIRILDKAGALDADEARVMRLHPGHGRDMVLATGEFDSAIIEAVTHHHEFLDGSGYPDGLQGASIGDLTRIITIVDVFAALVEDRCYRRGLPLEQAIAILRAMRGKVEGSLVDAFRRILLDAPGLPAATADQDPAPLRRATSR